MEQIVYLSGFPRSGSTLISNILAMHPDVKSTPSSPLCGIVQNMRRSWSDDPFFLSQLDDKPEEVHDRLKRATVAFMNSYSSAKEKIVVDKNREWLKLIQTLKCLYPDFQMIVTIRDPRDIFASIERKHEETLMFSFPDHMEHDIVDSRAHTIFSDVGVVGRIFKSIQNIGDIPNVIDHIYFWRYEDFLKDPEKTTETLFEWLKLKKFKINFNKIKQSTKEFDSHYRMKYPHKIKTKLTAASFSSHPEIVEKFKCKPTTDAISPRILQEITRRFEWFYREYYPEYFPQTNKENEKEIAEEIEKELEKESK